MGLHNAPPRRVVFKWLTFAGWTLRGAGLHRPRGVAMTLDKDLFRQVAGSFASGVTVVTTGLDGNYHGMTASSFSSLSLDPPLILVCFDLTAATLAAVDATGAFVINILGSQQEQLSRQFASRGAHSL